jgi:hypothetical protein
VKTKERTSTTMPSLSKITKEFPPSIVTMSKISMTKTIPFLQGLKWQQNRKCDFVIVTGVVLVVARAPSAVKATTSKQSYRVHLGVAGERWKQPLA